MLVDHYPEKLSTLADLAAEGIHDPAEMPFVEPWTDQPPAKLARSVVLHHWSRVGGSTPEDWRLPLVVFLDGTVVGTQHIGARNFATIREVHTGSWLGQRHQGQGIGTEMRAAVLHLAFEGLGAREATSAAFDHNESSYRVSRKLGYQLDGIERYAVRGSLSTARRLRLTRAEWEKHRTVPVEIDGLAPCLPFLGVDTGSGVLTPDPV